MSATASLGRRNPGRNKILFLCLTVFLLASCSVKGSLLGVQSADPESRISDYQEICESYGHQRNSPEIAQCVQEEILYIRERRDDVIDDDIDYGGINYGGINYGGINYDRIIKAVLAFGLKTIVSAIADSPADAVKNINWDPSLDTNLDLSDDTVKNISEDTDLDPSDDTVKDIPEDTDLDPSDDTVKDIPEDTDLDPSDDTVKDIPEDINLDPSDGTVKDIPEDINLDPSDDTF